MKKRVLKFIAALLALCIFVPVFSSVDVLAFDKTGDNYVEFDVSADAYMFGGSGLPRERGASAKMPPLTGDYEGAIEAIADAIREGESVVYLFPYKVLSEDMYDIYVMTLNRNPDLYYMSCVAARSSRNVDGVSYCNNLYVTRELEAGEIAQCEWKVDYIMSLVDDSMTEAEKCLVVHDYIVLNCSYAVKELHDGTLGQTPHVYDAYGILVNEYGVCAGYALAYWLVMGRLGFEVDYVVSEDGTHAWNVIKVDGEWYHVDCTWDDPTPNTEGYCGHTNFLRSDSKIGHMPWVTEHPCTSTRFDNEWFLRVTSEIYVRDSVYYYIDKSTSPNKFVARDGDAICVIEEVRNVMYYPSGYNSTVGSQMNSVDGLLYYSNNSRIYEYNVDTGISEMIYQAPRGCCISEFHMRTDGVLRLWFTNMRSTDDYLNINIYEYVDEMPTLSPTATNTPTPTNTNTPTPTATNTPTPTEAPERSAAGFARRLYTEALARQADDAGIDYWVTMLESGVTGSDAAREFLLGEEVTNDASVNDIVFIRRLYGTFMGRVATNDEVSYWYVLAINNGLSREDLFNSFVDSQEWANICYLSGIASGSSVEPDIEITPSDEVNAFVTRLYTTCLGREADEAGVNYWATELANDRAYAAGVARDFFFGDEFTSLELEDDEFITRLYLTFMGREASEEEISYWVELMEVELSRETVFEEFCGSEEFMNLCEIAGIRVYED